VNAAPREPGTRRRVAERRPRPSLRVTRAAVVPAVLVLLALVGAGLTAVSAGTGTPTTAGTVTGALVDRTTFACPDLTSTRGTTTSVGLGLAPAPSDVQPADGGSVTQGPVTSEGRPVDVRRGSAVGVAPDGGPAVVATGGAAAGLFGYRTDSQRGRALGVTSCPAPRAQWWFTGAGAGLDHASTLVLANVDPGPAVLDLKVLGPDGPVDTVATEGITLAPHSVKRVELSEIAPQTDEIALGVSTSRGRVVASVDDRYAAKASVTQGQEWLSGTDLPSRTLRLAGVPGTRTAATLLVANPSELEAVVDVQLAGKSGSFAPTGLDAITVAPGAIESIDLSKVLPKKEPLALRLRSQVPVVASVRSVAGDDHAYATPVAPLVGPAAAPVVKGADATVQVTAGAVAAQATVTAYDAKGTEVDSTKLSVDARATATWSPKKGAAYVVVEPDSRESGGGTLHGAVTYDRGGLAAVPLTALPLRLERPRVRPGLR
jgi:hypothetical protein